MAADTKKYEDCKLNKATIISNVDGSDVDLTKAIDCRYYEGILNDTVSCDLVITNSGSTINGKNLLEGLPLVGTEDFELEIEDPKGNILKSSLNVNKVTPFTKEPQREDILISMTSEEFIRNEEQTSEVIKRYDGKISEHVKKILTDNLKTQKELFIEETSNNFNFCGNRRRSIYILNWLSKKSIPSVNGKRGETAGYFFFENADGFHFKSIDSLFAQEHVKSYIYGGQPTSSIAYDGEIVNLEADNRFVANQKLRMGVYKTKMIVFDPFNCKYDVVEQDAFDTEDGTTHAGKELPVINNKFSNQTTRTTYVLKDTGTLPTGNVKQQVEKNNEQIFEVDSILNQAIRRYNQFVTSSVIIEIAPDFSLRVGQTIFIDTSSGDAEGDQETDKLIGGKYLIIQLTHDIQQGKGQTVLGLVRDSIGRKGKPHNGSMVD